MFSCSRVQTAVLPVPLICLQAPTLRSLTLTSPGVAGKWCPRREWPSPADARAATEAARRGVLYSSVFLGSPGEYNSCKSFLHPPTRLASQLLSFKQCRNQYTVQQYNYVPSLVFHSESNSSTILLHCLFSMSSSLPSSLKA